MGNGFVSDDLDFLLAFWGNPVPGVQAKPDFTANTGNSAAFPIEIPTPSAATVIVPIQMSGSAHRTPSVYKVTGILPLVYCIQSGA